MQLPIQFPATLRDTVIFFKAYLGVSSIAYGLFWFLLWCKLHNLLLVPMKQLSGVLIETALCL